MLYLGDCIEIMKSLRAESVDVVFADPPYFLSNNGLSINSGRVVSVNKGEWDKKQNYSDVRSFTEKWINECFRLLKREGTIWISSTHHNIHNVQMALDKAGFRLINTIIWHKTDPPPLIYKTKFRFSYEFLLWYGKSNHHYFNYEKMYEIGNMEMHDVWTIPAVSLSEKRFGHHPTQKPELLLKRVIIASTKPGELILDPFSGSGTTYVVASKLNRRCIGIDIDKKYIELTRKRLGEIGIKFD